MPTYEPYSGLYKQQTTDTKLTSIQEAAKNAEIIGQKLGHYISLLKYDSLKVVITDGYDYAPVLQACINEIMKAGGGKVICPPGSFRIESTVYIHSTALSSEEVKSPITIEGAVPVVADLYNSVSKNVTRFIKKTAGVMIAVNWNQSSECVITSVARNITIRNIGFYGSGVLDTKYTKVYATVTATDAIEMRNAAINLEDSIFWTLRYGVNQPDTVLGVDNYCDQSNYKRLGFFNMGHSWLYLNRPDASTIDNIYGYDQAKTCVNGVFVRKAESLEVGKVLCAGKAMHLAQNFNLVNLNRVSGLTVSSIYGERIEGLLVNCYNGCQNITIENLGVRHYGKTYIKARDTRNLKFNITAHVEEGVYLDTATDPGDYSQYTAIANPLPIEVDIDITCFDVTVGKCALRNGVHGGGEFTETTLRTAPRMNKTAKGVFGDQPTIITVYHNGSAIVPRAHGVDLDWSELFGGTPTYNSTTGTLTFPASGKFGNLPSAVATPRKSPTGVRNIPYIVSNNPLTIELRKFDDSIVTTADIAFTLLVVI
ncbi:hypothetical protein AB3N02_13815 [Priestia aryabhattai]|uniref:hypothetical protein n=1 Tax=Priestia aryabhattai TaxID=412384 RepID=UPI0039A0A10E